MLEMKEIKGAACEDGATGSIRLNPSMLCFIFQIYLIFFWFWVFSGFCCSNASLPGLAVTGAEGFLLLRHPLSKAHPDPLAHRASP